MNPKMVAYITFLGNVASLLSNSNLPVTGVGRVVSLITLATTLLRNSAVAVDELTSLTRFVELLNKETRVPTDEEWAEWEGRHDALDARFADVRDEFAHEELEGPTN